MLRVRELDVAQTACAARALLELRPHTGPAPALVALIDGQRVDGYRVAGSFDSEGDEDAAAVAGFRIATNLAWGRHLYVDDLATLPESRGRGHAGALMRWLADEARRTGCAELHLDSGVGADRADAHRLYLNCGLRIAAHHFSRELGRSDVRAHGRSGTRRL
jgi:GNAT superfamily N-acetyltransferase